ncbi:Serine/threonine-protein kinase PknD [Myxococcus stipitatus]
MGRVYLAEDTALQRRVAIKFIGAEQSGPGQRDRLFAEARALARLRHPNVVAVYRVSEVGAHPYLVQEFLPGVSLRGLSTPLPPERVLAIALGLGRGLAAAHRAHVLHRDLKPDNVMVLPDGEVKLVDFGLAFTWAEPGDTEAATQPTVSIAGTRGYMAPEALRGEPPSPRGDVYGLGMVLHELLVGHRRFDATTASGAVEKPGPLDARPPGTELESSGSGLGVRLRALILRCLEHEPARRFASADALCAELERLKEESGAVPVPPGNPYRGLQAFDAEHRAFFFGRGTEVRAIHERLRAQALVLVAGDSGVGKSSLCRAGVSPLVTQAGLGDGCAYSVLSLMPGRRPLTALVAAVAGRLGLSEETLAAQVRQEPAAMARALRAAGSARGTLLFIDQLEELFTQSEPDEASLFTQVLGHLAILARGVRTLATVRGDSFTRLAALPGLEDEVARALFLVKPLGPEGTREAVVGPARMTGVAFETEALVDTLVASSARAPGGLPILQFTLAELWEARDPSTQHIREASLEALGGVAGALSRHADGAIAALPPEARLAARGLLLRLISPEGARVRRTTPELEAETSANRIALEALVRARLVVVRQDGEAHVHEVAHEALLEGWSTLRGWLEAARQERQVLERVRLAAAGWERADRSASALWSRRELDTVAAAGELALTRQESVFLKASRRALRRAFVRRLGLALALPFTALVAGGAAWIKGRHALERTVQEHLDEARTSIIEARTHHAAAKAAREDAFQQWDTRGARALTGAPRVGEAGAPEETWAEARKSDGRADEAYQRATQALDTALLLDSSRREARGLLAEVLTGRMELAEWFFRPGQRREALHRLASLDDDGTGRQRLLAPPILDITTEPPGAEVLLQHDTGLPGAPRLSESISLGPTPIVSHALARGPGSYVLTFQAPGLTRAVLPVVVSAGEHLRTHIPLPQTADIPEDFVYIPPGRFLFGSSDDEALRREFLQAPPLRQVTTEGYLIARHEVTFAEWLVFLDALPPEERRRRTPGVRSTAGALALTREKTGWRLMLQPTQHPLYANSGEPIRYPGRAHRAVQDWSRFPISAISLEDARAYLAWLDSSGRIRGARLCTEYEWERAARGADARLFPMGDVLGPDDANFDETYGRQPLGFGPDEVGAHPASASPFGVMDLAGNVIEWVRSVREPEEAVARGGSWYYDRISNRSNSRMPNEPWLRDIRIGLRVCAPAPAPHHAP